ncbi:MAG: hypothetical protein N2C12_17025 [Planctomycetales bacterium]
MQKSNDMDRNTPKTLLEDWQQRRNWLATASKGDRTFDTPQVKILNYLIRRYRDTPQASHPARFQLQGDMVWNERRIVVHQHLGRGTVAGVKNETEADARIGSILQRMALSGRSDDASSDPPDAIEDEIFPTSSVYPVGAKLAWKSIIQLLDRNMDADDQIQTALFWCPFLPAAILHHLCERLHHCSDNEAAAMILLCQCHNRRVIENAAWAWRGRVAAGKRIDETTALLEDMFCHKKHRDESAEQMRKILADDQLEVRLAAASLLEELGDLDDIGLLSDLLSLPTENEERYALLHVMRGISEKTT